MKVESESEVAQLCLTLSDPMDCSPPGSSVRGIFQATVLEWGAIAFSSMYVYIPNRFSEKEIKDLIPFTIAYGEGNGTPLQYSFLENPMDRGIW